MRGELPISFQLMYVEGLMARSPGDVHAALATCCHFDARDPWWVPAPLEQPAGGLPKVAVCIDPGAMGVDPQVADGVSKAADALADAGYPLEEADPPDLAEALRTWQLLLFNEVRAMMFDTIEQLSMADAPASLAVCDPFVPALDKDDLVRTFAERTRLFRDWLMFFQRYPLLLGPVSTEPPFMLGADLESTERSKRLMDSMRLVVAVNLLGLPVSVVPAGVAEGLPQAVQVIGPPFAEARCLQAGAGRGSGARSGYADRSPLKPALADRPRPAWPARAACLTCALDPVSGKAQRAAASQFAGGIVQLVALPVQVAAYAHYPVLTPLNVRMVEDAATPYAGYPGGGMQQPRVARSGFAPAELHVVHCLADKPVMRRRQVFPDLDLRGVGVQVF